MVRAAAALASPSAPRAPMAERLIEAATRIIIRDGYQALTVQAIERETGASRSLIHYHFGGKTGLLLAVVDTVFRDMDAPTGTATGESVGERVVAELEADRTLSADPGKMVLFVELLPHILRSDELRERLRLFYRRGSDEAAPPPGGAADDGARKRAAHQEHHRTFQRLLAEEYGDEPADDVISLTAAVLDGLGLQSLIDPGGVDHARRYRVWEDMVLTYLEARRTRSPEKADRAVGRRGRSTRR